jgi:hypothetical protein
MHTIDAKRILSDPLRLGDPLQVTAKKFLDGLAQAKLLAKYCTVCQGEGHRNGLLCECIAALPNEVTDAFLRGERSEVFG